VGFFLHKVYDTDPAVLERVVPNVTLEMNTALQMLDAAEGIKKALSNLNLIFYLYNLSKSIYLSNLSSI
jgi:hypothetical protein